MEPLSRPAPRGLRRRVPVFDVVVTPLNREEVLFQIGQAVEEGTRLRIAGHNLHSVYLTRTDRELRRFYESCELVLIDGMPLLLALNVGSLLGNGRIAGASRRLGSTDWIRQCAGLPEVRRIAVLGAGERSNRGAVEALLRWGGPQLECRGIPGDPWRHGDADAVAEQLRGFAPDVLLIGMGMPLQERVAAHLAEQCHVPVIATVGGAIDQLSGAQSLAPRWLGRLGFEWLWRLAAHPRRLARRYLIEPFVLAAYLVRGSSS